MDVLPSEFTQYFSLAALLAAIFVLVKLLLPIVQGLVAYFKEFGLSGNWCRILSMLFGLLIGGFCYVAVYGVPGSVPEAFGIFLMGILLGLAASGNYDLDNQFSEDFN